MRFFPLRNKQKMSLQYNGVSALTYVNTVARENEVCKTFRESENVLWGRWHCLCIVLLKSLIVRQTKGITGQRQGERVHCLHTVENCLM